MLDHVGCGQYLILLNTELVVEFSEALKSLLETVDTTNNKV